MKVVFLTSLSHKILESPDRYGIVSVAEATMWLIQ